MNDWREWVKIRTFGAGTEDVWREYQHTPCGTVMEVADGHSPSARNVSRRTNPPSRKFLASIAHLP